jgi:hypothetical protein
MGSMITFIEAPQFTKQVLDLFSDDDYRVFQSELAAQPEAGDIIPGLRGLRKVRVSAGGKGKRGGARCIYLYMPQAGTIYLFCLYTKGDISDLSNEQKKRLLTAVDAIKNSHEP